jgi:DNA helicase-2/ATP-dependent DNA helicase PcrA
MLTDLSGLNAQQKEAVLLSTDHNIVLLAGAGSGKSFTLVKRTEYLITDLGVDPSSIMLVTFTNKAANEIKERISKVTNDANKMWIGTFHRICTRLLRQFGDHLGIKSFSIMDTKDCRKIIKDSLVRLGEDDSIMNVKAYQTKISEFKNNLVGKEAVRNDDTISNTLKTVYEEYVDYCWKHKTFDFDDLITYTILLLSSFKDVSNWVHKNIQYIMVDECQDTNSAQFVLIKLLRGENNTVLVGDVNQSIYGFRNARPQYLENFANTTSNTMRLRLEQNYRSTKNIINAANNVVKYNSFGTKLEMFCDNEEGAKVQLYKANNSFTEAEWVISEILTTHNYVNKDYSDFAIIYRANFQSRLFEEALTKCGIPYVVFGSGSFYSRKEVKDLLAFCKCVVNPFDTDSFRRALSTFKGVGNKTIETIIENANTNRITLKSALEDYMNNSARPNIKPSLSQMYTVLDRGYSKCTDIIDNVFLCTRYRDSMAIINTDEARDSVQIMDEFKDMIQSIEERETEQTISEMLDEISLLTDAKGDQKANTNAVKLMTAHASKGLEFDTVFIVGAEEGLFPHANAIGTGNIFDIEEERRLFYVAMTRAEKRLYITNAKNKRNNNESVFRPVSASRFIDEIPENLKEYTV